MRKLYLLLAIAFLFQSCFSYKPMQNNPLMMEVGHTYKIQRNHKYDKVVFHSIKDSTIIFSKNFEKLQIPSSEITGIKKRKFSAVKTVVMPLAVIVAITGLFILTYDGPSTGGISFSKL